MSEVPRELNRCLSHCARSYPPVWVVAVFARFGWRVWAPKHVARYPCTKQSLGWGCAAALLVVEVTRSSMAPLASVNAQVMRGIGPRMIECASAIVLRGVRICIPSCEAAVDLTTGSTTPRTGNSECRRVVRESARLPPRLRPWWRESSHRRACCTTASIGVGEIAKMVASPALSSLQLRPSRLWLRQPIAAPQLTSAGNWWQHGRRAPRGEPAGLLVSPFSAVSDLIKA